MCKLDSQWFVLNVLSGGRGRSCVQGNAGNVCTENTNNSSLSAEPCRGQACPLRCAAATTSSFLQDSLWYSAPDLRLLLVSSRWRAEPWSPCSASCGGGSQTRRVRCVKGPDSRWREVGSQHCLVTGRRASIVRVCNQQPCGRWTTTQWGPVSPSAAMMLFLIVPWLFLSAHVQPFLPLFSNLGAILPTSVTVSVWVPVWPLSTDTFTAATPTPLKSLTGCAARSWGESCVLKPLIVITSAALLDLLISIDNLIFYLLIFFFTENLQWP